MKFMMTYSISTADIDDAIARFLETGGGPTGNVTMINRWHAAAGRFGFVLLEGEDVAAIYQYATEWGDLCDLDITPVLEDEEAGAVLQSMQD
jgi:hypothetical protein